MSETNGVKVLYKYDQNLWHLCTQNWNTGGCQINGWILFCLKGGSKICNFSKMMFPFYWIFKRHYFLQQVIYQTDWSDTTWRHPGTGLSCQKKTRQDDKRQVRADWQEAPKSCVDVTISDRAVIRNHDQTPKPHVFPLLHQLCNMWVG